MIVKTEYIKLSKPFITENNEVIKKPIVAYEEYGNMNGPVVFIAHGGLQNHHVAGKYKENETPGVWDYLIGPNKAIDTNKFRVISANSLGSMYGSSSPLSINPDTNKKYGPDFPRITLIDMVKFYKQFLDEMNIEKLYLMAGPSMGSLQSLQMAALYPDFIGSVISIATSGTLPPSGIAFHNFMINAIKLDPKFNNGWYEETDNFISLKIISQAGRIYYTHERVIKTLCWDKVEQNEELQQNRIKNIDNYLTSGLDQHLKGRDPNCYISLLEAINSYDLGRDIGNFEKGVHRIKCPVLLINFTTDIEFSPFWAEDLARIINLKNPNQAKVNIIDSMWGHVSCIKEIPEIEKSFRTFLEALN